MRNSWLPASILVAFTFSLSVSIIASTFLTSNLVGQEKEKPVPTKTDIWQMQATDSDASLRGLHVLSDKLVWCSGTGGTVLRTLDGGQNWEKTTVKGAEKLDFRDIHAFDQKQAVILSAGTPARVYRTVDGAKSWEIVFEHKNDKAFFDAISFWDDKNGIAMSDPIDDRILLIRTKDGGKSWQEMESENRPKCSPGEGGFAASGTNMVILPNGRCLIALGSALKDEQFKKSRVVFSDDQGKSWSVANVPMPRNQSTGIFSMAFSHDRLGVAVGGDYLKPDLVKGNIAVTNDGGKSWSVPDSAPGGYRSGVAAGAKIGSFIAVGTNGTDESNDAGLTWDPVSKQGFHAVQFTPDGKTVWASGGNGAIGKWKRD